jgi:hypothetical protein
MDGLLMPVTYWYSWPSQAEFDAWHEPVVQALHLPRVGINAATGQPNPTAQRTTAYTIAIEIAADDWRAQVEPTIAATFPNGLGTPTEPPPQPPLPIF